MLQVKRVYEEVSDADGYRVLVDRLWPRGLSKERAQVDLWLKEVGPSRQLRQAFHGGEIDFAVFRQKYQEELKVGATRQAFFQLQKIIQEQSSVTLLFAAKNQSENQAVVLFDLLKESGNDFS